MSDPHHGHHHHHHGSVHPPSTVGASILRLSVGQRVAFAAIPLALLWLAVFWATR